MDPMSKKEGLEVDLQIEELEARIAPDSGETVLPLPRPDLPFFFPRPR